MQQTILRLLFQIETLRLVVRSGKQAICDVPALTTTAWFFPLLVSHLKFDITILKLLCLVENKHTCFGTS